MVFGLQGLRFGKKKVIKSRLGKNGSFFVTNYQFLTRKIEKSCIKKWSYWPTGCPPDYGIHLSNPQFCQGHLFKLVLSSERLK